MCILFAYRFYAFRISCNEVFVMKKIIALALAAMMLLATFAGCGAKTGTTLADVQKAGKLTIATSPDFPPFESLGENGAVTGIEIDILNLICAELGVELDMEDQKIATFQELADFIESKLN